MLERDRPPRTLVAVRGSAIVPIAHCQFAGCPFGWPADTGRRYCPDHDGQRVLAIAAESLGISLTDDMTETMSAAPGRDGQQRLAAVAHRGGDLDRLRHRGRGGGALGYDALDGNHLADTASNAEHAHAGQPRPRRAVSGSGRSRRCASRATTRRLRSKS